MEFEFFFYLAKQTKDEVTIEWSLQGEESSQRWAYLSAVA